MSWYSTDADGSDVQMDLGDIQDAIKFDEELEVVSDDEELDVIDHVALKSYSSRSKSSKSKSKSSKSKSYSTSYSYYDASKGYSYSSSSYVPSYSYSYSTSYTPGYSYRHYYSGGVVIYSSGGNHPDHCWLPPLRPPI